MTIHTGAKVDKLEKNADSVKATIMLKDGKQDIQEFSRGSSPWASLAMWKISGWKSWA